MSARGTTTLDRPGTQAATVLAVALGRGRVGKSTALRWVIGRARNAGREIVVADYDRRNPTLAAFYPEARQPASAETEDVKEGLTGLLNDMVERQASVALDLGGGDDLLNEYGRDLPLVEFCQDTGIAPLALLCLGPDLADLQHAAAIEASGAFAPERTIIVLNEGLVPVGRLADRAFAPVMEAKEFRSLVERGAQPVLMPRLPCIAEIDRRRLDFWAAAEGAKGADGTPIGPVQRSQTKAWLYGRRRPDGTVDGGMEQVFAPWAGWLP